MARGTGITTRQIVDAPRDAVFVWVNSNLKYPKMLAKGVGRDDLQIVSPEWLTSHRWVGRVFSGVVLDHALVLTSNQYEAWRRVVTAIRSSWEVGE